MSGTDKMAENISSSQRLMEFLQRKAQNHTNLKTYGTYKSISPIIEEGVLRLSDGSNWNDKFDSSAFQYNSKEYLQFGKCFTFSKSESVAMWMIYGRDTKKKGKDLRGLMIDFKKQLNKIVNETEEVVLYNYSKGKIKKGEKKLSKGEFEIFLIDMLYISQESDGRYTIKRSDERIEGIESEMIDDVIEYTKSYPWAYENECRLIVRVKKDILGDANYNSARLKLPSTVHKVLRQSVYKTPLYHGEDYEIPVQSSKLEGNISF